MRMIKFFKNGKEFSNEEILKIELIRSRKIMSLIMEKIGAEGIVEIFKKEIDENKKKNLQWSDGCSHKDYIASKTEASITGGGTGAEFIDWYWHQYVSGVNSLAMLRAHPEHVGIIPIEGGLVGILEVPGHTNNPHLLPFRKLTTEEWKNISIPLTPDYPDKMLGSIILENKEVAYLVHEFKNTEKGFDVKLAIYWPNKAPTELIKGHSDHLAVEFNNWFQLYLLSKDKRDTNLLPLILHANIEE